VKKTNLSSGYAALPHILVIDDDDRIRELVCRYLTEHGFFVSEAQDAAHAKEILNFASYDALVVDVMMPGQTGFEFTTELRRISDIPVVLLTAMGEVDDKITGLEIGADDYLTKPFDPRELVLRLEAILRRRPSAEIQNSALQIGDKIFNPEQNELVQGEALIKLTDSEATLLKALAARKGEIISRDDLAAACSLDPDGRTIDVQVTRLRRKIEEDNSNPRYLQTVRGKGYRLQATRYDGE